MIQAIRICFSKYAQFEGRARRAEFWWFTFFLILFGYGIDLVYTMIWGEYEISSIEALLLLAIYIPGIAVGVRRLHDINLSGWWHLLSFLPVVGWIVLMALWAMSGNKGENRFGSDPI